MLFKNILFLVLTLSNISGHNYRALEDEQKEEAYKEPISIKNKDKCLNCCVTSLGMATGATTWFTTCAYFWQCFSAHPCACTEAQCMCGTVGSPLIGCGAGLACGCALCLLAKYFFDFDPFHNDSREHDENIFHCIEAKNSVLIIKILDKQPNILNIKSYPGLTPVAYALFKADTATLKLLSGYDISRATLTEVFKILEKNKNIEKFREFKAILFNNKLKFVKADLEEIISRDIAQLIASYEDAAIIEIPGQIYNY